EASVAAIGPAGENGVHGAAICNDLHHVAASGGVGAIMGLKRLKAIASSGAGSVPAADGFELMRITQEWIPLLDRIGWTVLPQRYEKFSLEGSRVAVRNLESAAAGYEFARSVEAGARRFEVKRVACYGCPIACTYRATITDGPYEGYVATLAGGGENMEGAAGMAGVTEPGTVLYMTDLCDRLGFSSGEVGIALGWAFECYERGLISRQNTGGLELTWGNAGAAMTLMKQMARREGFGALLAEGPRHAARKVGKGSERYLVHVKGSGFNLHDWRIHWTILLGQAVSQAGGCWQGGGMVDYYPDPDLGYPEPRPIAEVKGTPEASRKTQIKRLWEDTVGICLFSVVPSHAGMIHLPVRAVAAATGWKDFALEEALRVGERVMNLERLFSVKRGRTLLHDLDVGEKLLEAPRDGLAAGKALGPHLRGMVQEYYRLNGWDPETGNPLPETLRRLGLEAFAA
ncbi:MAG: aldehyde ferredoxin oxidoreductase C-terminal domain-containing protein, partial [Nitrospinota bacterium]